MLFLEILNEEKIIVDEAFQDLVIFKYIIEKLILIYLCNNIDKDKLKEANKYAFLDINKDYYKDMEEKIRSEFINIEKDIKDNQKKCKEAIEKVLSKVEYYDITKKLTNLKIINGD